MASAAVVTETKKITDLRVIDLKTELKRRNLDVNGVKNVLITRLKQAIEEEGGDAENIEITVSAETPTKKVLKSKGRKSDAADDGDATMEEESSSKEAESLDQDDSEDAKDMEDERDSEEENVNSSHELLETEMDAEASRSATEMEDFVVREVDKEESKQIHLDEEDIFIRDEAEDEDNEKDVTDTDEGTRENSKHLASEESLAEAEQAAQDDREIAVSAKEAEDDNISITIQAEDAITLEFDGDDLLDTGKNVKLPDSEARKSHDEPEASSQMCQDKGKDIDVKENHKDGKKEDGVKAEPAKKETRESSKKAETGDKEKDSVKKGPSSSGASGQAKSSSKDKDGKTSSKDDKGGSTSGTGGSSSSFSSSSRNLWVSGLSSNTKAADLKNLFGKYGKVLSAKVVTNARSPGAKCYGIVTVSSSTEASRCISHIHRTELHGQQISVEKVKSDPFKKESTKKDGEEKSSSKSEKRQSTSGKTGKTQGSKKEEKKSDKSGDKESKEGGKKQDVKDEKAENTSGSALEISKKEDKKRAKSPSKMTSSQSKGDLAFNKMKPMLRKGRLDKVFSYAMARRPRGFLPPEEINALRSKGKFFPNKDNFRPGRRDIVSFEKMKEQRMRERLIRLERIRRAMELRRRREIAERERREREKIRLLREREERERLQRERERLEIERQKLERERLERERLERERIRIEQERRKEAERIAREREELRRQQEQLRYEQEKRSSLKRSRDVDHRRDDSYWNGNKKIQTDTDSRLGHGSDFNRQQNRFNDFNHRERSRYPENSSVQPSTFERRDRFENEADSKKTRPARREGSGFDRYPKNYDNTRRAEQPHTELRDNERREMRDRDERRAVPIPERPSGNRGHPTERGRVDEMPHSRPSRDSGPGGWKNETGIGSDKDLRGAVRMRPERSGRDGPGSSIRTVPPSSRGRSSYGSREDGRAMMMERVNSGASSFRHPHQKNFTEGRQVIVERHSRDQAPRKDWHGPSSQGSSYHDSRRISDGRGNMMSQQHSRY
ncbi:SAFB-like transcription modulator isoform X2 [Polypterus senegalus]|uniref:SAFB-like transcription modulator isoform X2 n=1 Tax=Polypterus senegalus TaxID=55291 RepID=UPI00196503F3|nr:SAFB-like transcription modulator isoform X2 [Polypterus senegalus]